MKKGFLVFLVFAVIAAGGAFAQEKYDGSKKNTIFFGPVMAGYERALNQRFSIGVEAGANFFGIVTDPAPGQSQFEIIPYFADGFVRWYPWQRIFFVNFGLGYQYSGFHIKTQAGWKIDIGKPGGWVFETRAGFGMTFGGDGSLLTITVPVLFGRTF